MGYKAIMHIFGLNLSHLSTQGIVHLDYLLFQLLCLFSYSLTAVPFLAVLLFLSGYLSVFLSLSLLLLFSYFPAEQLWELLEACHLLPPLLSRCRTLATPPTWLHPQGSATLSQLLQRLVRPRPTISPHVTEKPTQCSRSNKCPSETSVAEPKESKESYRSWGGEGGC